MTSVRDLMEPEPAPFTGTPWWEQRMVGFDLETTAADPEEARIVVAAVVEVGAGLPPVSRSWLVDPGIPIPAEATAVHGITTEQAREAGYFAGDVIAELVEHLARRPEGAALVDYNAPFDVTILDREARRYGVEPLTDRGPLLVVDPLVIDKHLDRYRSGSRKLADVAARYGADLDGDGHDADFDALLACRLAWAIATRGRVIRKGAWEQDPLQHDWDRIRPDLAALHEAQRQWAYVQARGLARHLRQEIRTDWPLVPCSVPLIADQANK